MTNFFSRLFGKFANTAFWPPIQLFINKLYVKIFNINLSEFSPISSYKTLNELFTRKLVIMRDFDTSKDVIISPCDALITELGSIKDNLALQIKNKPYEIPDLLGEELEFLGFFYINLYLSPRDYHRFHAPCDMEILQVKYFSGALLPVNEPSLNKNDNLFIRNERVVVKARVDGKIMYFVAVGALNVGKIHLNFDPNIQTNMKNVKDNKTYFYKDIFIKKGEELGRFEMGSTIVLIAQNMMPIIDLKECANKVKFAQAIAKFEANNG
ncbi:MAG: phosphatidylserine decarboxylase [Helicobacter sp.]|nr:phosphatidylserine decarboxylase [Helicobacter sp.]